MLHGGFRGHVPSSNSLRRLTAITARPEVLAKFAARHARLTEAWFLAPQPLPSVSGHLLAKDINRFSASPSRLDTIRVCTADFLLLMAGVPDIVRSLQSIVLDEDLTWSDFKLDDGPSLVR